MNSEKILDALGEISEDLVREAKEKEPVKRRRFLPWAVAAMAAVLAAVLLIPRFLPKDPVVPPGCSTTNNKGAVNVFSIDGHLYGLRRNGEFIWFNEEGETLITVFPTHLVTWSDSLGGLVYFDRGIFYVADPQTGQVISEIRPAKRFRTKEVTYVLFTTKDALYFRSGTTSYKLDLQDHSVTKTGSKLDFPATAPFCENDNGYLFIDSGSGSEHFLWMDKESGEMREILAREKQVGYTFYSVISACMTEDELYYVCWDGTLFRCALRERTEPERIALDRRLLAVAAHGKELLLTFHVSNGQIPETGVMLLKPDGEEIPLKEGGAPLVSNPAACRLAVGENGWLLAVAGEEECVYGQWNP